MAELRWVRQNAGGVGISPACHKGHSGSQDCRSATTSSIAKEQLPQHADISTRYLPIHPFILQPPSPIHPCSLADDDQPDVVPASVH
jgi:hypothetical protein